MSEHLWTQEYLAAYVAGGLTSEERERIERHVAECSECARDVETTEALDRKLGQLFAADQPAPTLEDTMVQSLRSTSRRHLRFGRFAHVLAAAAAIAIVAVVGASVTEMIDEPKVFQSRGQVLVQKAGGAGPVYAGLASNYYVFGNAGSPEAAPQDLETLAQQVRTDSHALLIEDLDAKDVKAREGKKLEDFAVQNALPGKPGAGRPMVTGGGGGPAAWGRQLEERKSEPKFEAGTTSLSTKSDKAQGLAGSGTAYFLPMQAFEGRNPAPHAGPGALPGLRPGGGFGALGAGPPPLAAPVPPRAGIVDNMTRDAGAKGTKGVEVAGEQPQPLAQGGPADTGRKIIRTGEIDFIVDSFDDAVAAIQKLVAASKGGFIATINSDKLANGKVKGSVVLRVPPEQLDALVLGLRKDLGKMGELKGQRIGSQDITKQYTDLESRLRAARTMEERLLKIIQEGKGVIKDLLQAEKELGTWRTRIEEMEGELRFYANQVSLSTLTINLTEKEIRLAAAVTETERVQAGIEVEDVDKAYRAALLAISEAKGRVTRSEVKQHGAGQYNALLHFEVAHDAAGPMRDRLRQLGTLVRFEIDRVQHAEGGGKLPEGGKLERGPTQFQVSLYNIANVAPRETIVQKIAAVDVPLAYKNLREAIVKAQGRVVNAQLNEQDRQNVTAQLDFDLRRTEEALPQATLAEIGETLSRNVSRVPEGENVTDAKVLYRIEIVSAANIEPRETVLLGVEVMNVKVAQDDLTAHVKAAEGRVVKASKTLERNGQVTARIIIDVPLASSAALVEKIRNSGHVRVDQTAQNQQAPSGKLAIARVDATLTNEELLVPRDEGLWAQLRYGLSISLRGLALSAGWLIIGMLFVLPWVALVMVVVWVARRLWRPRPQTPAA